jgi:hypothetical protein
MPRGSYLLRSGTITVILGEPIPTQGLSDADRTLLIERVRSVVENMLRDPASKSREPGSNHMQAR